jgi:hypothetical protein
VIIQPQLPGGYVIFCDDIREEVNGKHTLVGTYGAEMTVFGTAPVRLQQLWACVRYRDDPASLPKKITVQITRDVKGKSDVALEVSLNLPVIPEEFPFPQPIDDSGIQYIEMQMNAQMRTIEFVEPCVLRVKALVGDDEYRLGGLSVKIAPPPQT